MADDYNDQIKYKESPYNIDSDKAITALGMRKALGTKEDVANRQEAGDAAATLDSNSLDTKYPSSKLVGANLATVRANLSAEITNRANADTALQNGKEASIAAGTTAQYWRGDKTWQTLSDSHTHDTRYYTETEVDAKLSDKQDKIAAASGTADGLMSAADKAKLSGIAENANNYTHPTATEYGSGLYKVTVNGLGHVTAATAATKADITALGIPGSDTTYAHPTATEYGSGLYKVTV
ncbi:hypothetical protein NO2_1657, partial [Candidatus Termititenax persephonae]